MNSVGVKQAGPSDGHGRLRASQAHPGCAPSWVAQAVPMWKFAVVGKKAAIVAGGTAVAAYSAYEWRKATEKLGGGKHLDDSQVDRIFAEIDKDGSGAIDEVELKAALEKAGLGSNAVGLMLLTADQNRDGKLSKAEFRSAMLGEKSK